MKDFSCDNIEKASEEAFRMRQSSKFFDEDYEPYKCNCRFEKKRENPPLHQNGKPCHISSSIDDDKMLILALILILSKNCNDKFLMMALLYIIM